MNPENLTIVTLFCGREGDDLDGWFASASQVCRNVCCVAHDLNGIPDLPQRISEAAAAHGVTVSIVRKRKTELAERGFSDFWNCAIELVRTPWLMIMASDERITMAERLSGLGDTLAECLLVNFVEVNGKERLVYRCFRTDISPRFRGLVHEEVFAGDGRHFTSFVRGTSSVKLVHSRTGPPRTIHALLLLRAFFDTNLRGGTNSWWFDVECVNRFRALLIDAKNCADGLGMNLHDALRIPMDWDAWRRTYDKWPFEAHQLFYDAVYRSFPTQRFGSWQYVADKLASIGKTDVVEIGGWDGFVAFNAMEQCLNIASWHNYEICSAVASSGLVRPGYFPHSTSAWPWDMDLEPGDTFVALHTLEHMKAAQIEKLLARNQSWERACIEVPIGDADGEQWHGYNGTHILEIGWPSLIEMFERQGFDLRDRSGQCAFLSKV